MTDEEDHCSHEPPTSDDASIPVYVYHSYFYLTVLKCKSLNNYLFNYKIVIYILFSIVCVYLFLILIHL